MLGLIGALAIGCADAKEPATDTFEEFAGLEDKSDQFAGRMTLVGTIAYDQTRTVRHPANRWTAFRFLGNTGDQVVIDVSSSNGDTVAWLLDKSMNILAFNDDHGTGTNSHLEATLANAANTTFYIVVRDYYRKAMTYSLSLKKKITDFAAPCRVDADCAITTAACCGSEFAAVRADLVSDFRNSLTCDPRLRCALYLPRDVGAQCQDNRCVAVNVEDISCGGRTLNPHSCPDDYQCMGEGLAVDRPGQCEETCGGIAAFACNDPTDICVDVPWDGCDPSSGGADCGGVCRDEICSGQTARCAAGYSWSKYECNCVPNPCNLMDCAPLSHCEVTADGTRGQCVPDSPTTDCRSAGCGTGQYCTFCWTSYACIPDGAVC